MSLKILFNTVIFFQLVFCVSKEPSLLTIMALHSLRESNLYITFPNCVDRNKNNKDKCMFLLYLHANAVNNNKGGTGSAEQTSGLAMEFSIKVTNLQCTIEGMGA